VTKTGARKINRASILKGVFLYRQKRNKFVPQNNNFPI